MTRYSADTTIEVPALTISGLRAALVNAGEDMTEVSRLDPKGLIALANALDCELDWIEVEIEADIFGGEAPSWDCPGSGPDLDGIVSVRVVSPRDGGGWNHGPDIKGNDLIDLIVHDTQADEIFAALVENFDEHDEDDYREDEAARDEYETECWLKDRDLW